eukprot:gene11096-12092_t
MKSRASQQHHPISSSICGGLRIAVIIRLTLLWLLIICAIVTSYLLFIPVTPTILRIPDPIEVFFHHKSMNDSARGNTSHTTFVTSPVHVQAEVEADKDVIKLKREKSKTRFAYVTLLHGIDETFAYRGYLYNCIIMREALRRLGSKMDFIVMVGFSYPNQLSRNNSVSELIRRDLQLLERYDVRVFFLPRLHSFSSLQTAFDSLRVSGLPADDSQLFTSAMLNSLSQRFEKQKVNFLEMALLKITPWSFGDYEKLQYMDGDVLPRENMDCLFQLNRNSFNTGTASPLNSGWFLAITNTSDFQRLLSLSVLRFVRKWNEVRGWGSLVPSDLLYRGQQRNVKKWDFNGASLDQGLFTHYFALHEGRMQLFDVKDVIEFDASYTKRVISRGLEQVVDPLCPLQSKRGRSPMDFFYHFTGRNKPWLQNLSKPKDAGVVTWIEIFDSLNLSVNSTTIRGSALKPPLGYFHPNKR